MSDLYALVIGASIDSIYAINEAKKMEFTVIAFDGNAQAEGLKYADISIVIDITKPELIIDKLSELNIKPDIILPVPIGKMLNTIGILNDHYNLTGATYKNADICTDKYNFHNLLFNNGLRQIKCELLKQNDNSININDFQFNYPVIFKPRYGSGSRSVYLINNKIELVDIVNKYLPLKEDFIVEEFVDGTEYGVDGAVIDGKFNFVLLREKILTSYPYRQCIGYFSIFENNIIFNEINCYLSKVIKSLNLNNVLLHADIIYNNKNIFIVEIAPRPSGHYLHNIFVPIVTGVNMINEFINFAVPSIRQNYSFIPKYNNCMLIKYFDFENCNILKVPDNDFLMNKYPLINFEYNNVNRVMERVIDGQSIMKRGYFILEGKNKTELEYFSKNILNEFVIENVS